MENEKFKLIAGKYVNQCFEEHGFNEIRRVMSSPFYIGQTDRLKLIVYYTIKIGDYVFEPEAIYLEQLIESNEDKFKVIRIELTFGKDYSLIEIKKIITHEIK